MTDATTILEDIERGDPHSSAKLLPIVYQELRRLAAQRLSREAPGQTLQPTALVHEAYLRLVDVERVQHWNSRGHFFAAAAEAMRRILVERARRKRRIRHGGGHRRAAIELDDVPGRGPEVDVVALDEALRAFQAEDPVKAQLVTLRYFGGLTEEQAATILCISRVTAHRHWAYARAWLHRHMSDGERRAGRAASVPPGNEATRRGPSH